MRESRQNRCFLIRQVKVLIFGLLVKQAPVAGQIHCGDIGRWLPINIYQQLVYLKRTK